MSLSDLASLGSFVSGVAVLVSLVYLALQVRQAERNQQAAIRDSRATRIVDTLMRLTEPALAEAIAKCQRGDPEATDLQIRQYLTVVNARLVSAEEIFNQHREGLLSETHLDNLGRAMASAMSSPGERVAYRRMRPYFGEAFIAFVDAIVAKTPVRNDTSSASTFRTDAAAERARAV